MIKSIHAINFLSWKELSFDIQNGTTLISGFNYDDNRAEGSGKSAIFNALCYGLFGRLPKDTSVDSVIKEGESTCSVYVELNDGTVIERSRKPNDLCMWGLAASEPTRGKDIKDTQKLIEKKLGFTFNTFITVVYFAQNNPNSFIHMSEEEKAKVLSELQDLSQFDKARKQALDNLKTLKQSIELCTQNYVHQTNLENSYKEQKEKLELAISNFEVNKEKKLQELANKCGEAYGKISNFKDEVLAQEEIDVLKQANEEVRKEQTLAEKTRVLKINLQATFKRNEQELASLIDTHAKLVEGGTCPTCGGLLCNSNEKVYNDTLNSLVANINELKLSQENILLQKNELKEVHDIEVLNDVYNKNKVALSILEKQLIENKLLKRDILNFNNAIESTSHSNCDDFTAQHLDLSNKLQLVSKNRGVYNEELLALNKEYGHLEVVKDGFKEVKQRTYIGFLNEINRLVNKYAAELFEVPIFIRFNNLGEDGEIGKVYTEIVINNVTRSLGLLSGGQVKRLELAVFLSLNEIINNRLGNTLNIRILDEVMTNLSMESSKKIVALLKSLAGSTLIIEHNELVKSIVDDMFNIEYRNGTSRKV